MSRASQYLLTRYTKQGHLVEHVAISSELPNIKAEAQVEADRYCFVLGKWYRCGDGTIKASVEGSEDYYCITEVPEV